MPRNILALMVILGLFLPGAEAKVVVQNSQYGYSFELPDGFTEIKAKVAPGILSIYAAATPRKQTPISVTVGRLNGVLDPPPVPIYFNVPKGFTAEYTQAPWKSYKLPIARMSGSRFGAPSIDLDVEIPLQPEGILVMISGPATEEDRMSEAFQMILSTLDGKCAWPPGAVATVKDAGQPPASPVAPPAASPRVKRPPVQPTPVPMNSAPAGPIPVAVSTPGGNEFQLTATTIARGNLTNAAVIFPPEQLPADPKPYSWVETLPNGQVVTAHLNLNVDPLGPTPGVYKVYIEYHLRRDKRVVSNVLQVTVPGN